MVARRGRAPASAAANTAPSGVLFSRDLEVFRTEAEAAAQFFYAFLAIHAVAGDEPAVQRLLNTAPLFWNTNLGALQMSTFIPLGRIFDQASQHNVDRLLNIAQNNSGIFSKAALAARKQGTSPILPNWLADYLDNAYVPTATDFRRLRRYAQKYRTIYVGKYRDLRHMLFAHKTLSDEAQIRALFAKTNIREIQRLIGFLMSLYHALWQLFENGRKPALRQQRYSVKRMREKPLPKGHVESVQERITLEADRFLFAAATWGREE